MKIRLGTLRRVIREAIARDLVLEKGGDDDEDEAAATDGESADDDAEELDDELDQEEEDDGDEQDASSLDVQIDHFLIEYEKSASEKNESLRRGGRRFIFEEDDGPELPADAGGGSTGKFDVGEFASSVARLIENFDSLVEIKQTVMRRAEAFVRKGHDDESAQLFVETMRDQHGVDDGSDGALAQSADPPPAVGAGVPAGGGP